MIENPLRLQFRGTNISALKRAIALKLKKTFFHLSDEDIAKALSLFELKSPDGADVRALTPNSVDPTLLNSMEPRSVVLNKRQAILIPSDDTPNELTLIKLTRTTELTANMVVLARATCKSHTHGLGAEPMSSIIISLLLIDEQLAQQQQQAAAGK